MRTHLREYFRSGYRVYYQAFGKAGGWKVHGVVMLPLPTRREAYALADRMRSDENLKSALGRLIDIQNGRRRR